ncbi:DIP1984 family protein [Thermoflavimicrobium dichotomicum]|uniref:Septicolysin n=1 Tax=Thermoflavimicrobium dichotomicum TaxID=46223 RepID=A0A1I3UUA4_9BACL|nr:DIP1984 family protein [Thermoflavimicrobium dichotomicum]SFJ86239.1 hypothetical protein SAMN05421852_1281 [Thermoflavimicrobium dichotomicum]
MKLAEALILRADCQKRIEQLKVRLSRSAKVQEGETPPEDPQALLKEMEGLLKELNQLIVAINRTNASVKFNEEMTLADALALRDVIGLKRKILAELIDAATVRQDRYSQSEIKYLSTINVAEVQKQVDKLSKEYRELDFQIQELNWKTEVID